MNRKQIDIKQKEVLAQFYSNFALAWFSFGLVSPIFNPVDDVVKLIIGMIVSLIAGSFFMRTSLIIFEEK